MYLGINAFVHDASAAIIDKDGRIIAAVEEERFSRVKRESRFPVESIKYCLKEAGISINELDGIGFGWKPSLLLFQRILWSNIFAFPASFSVIKKNFQTYIKMRSAPNLLKKHFDLNPKKVPFKYFRHHACHAASAYYSSPFEDAAFLTIDGKGELESITWGTCTNGKITKLGQSYSPHSIGRLYSATCLFLGFSGSEKEGTAMALAAYGTPEYLDQYRQILQLTKNKKNLKVRVNTAYFDLSSNDLALPSKRFQKTFKMPPRKPEENIEQVYKNIAASLQKRTEEVIVELVNRLHIITGQSNLVLAGGVALNSVLNGKFEYITPFKKVFIQPAASDVGLSLGAAYIFTQSKNKFQKLKFPMETAALGPSFADDECEQAINKVGLKYKKAENITKDVAKLLSDGKLVAWFQGRMEFGPRALGHRSLLADPRPKDMIGKLNEVKKREYFRPFAISILHEEASRLLEKNTDSPFMLKVDNIKTELKDKVPSAQHIDGSVRIQTLKKDRDGIYYDLVKDFFDLTGTPLIINTSLNIKGQPIVCTPSEAIDTFIDSKIDVLAIESFLMEK